MKFTWWRGRRDMELDEEVRGHLEMAAQERTERGESREDAEAAARRQFGNVELVKEVTRDTWGWRWLEQFAQDLRYGIRQLLRNPGFTLVAVLTLALGIGANTAIFSVINAVMLRPLPAPHADRLVHIYSLNVDISNSSEWKRQTLSYEQFAPVSYDHETLRGKEGLERLDGMRVAPEFLLLLGVRPLSGRIFLAEEAVPGGAPVAILSEKFWRQRFGGQHDAIGQQLILRDKVHTVVGVLPEDFGLLSPYSDVDILLPLAADAPAYIALARLRPGVTLAAAQAEAMDLAARVPHNPRLTANDLRIFAHSFKDSRIFSDTRIMLLVLAGAVGFVLMIACVNVANLLFARAAGRGREVAIRNALGAGRHRLVRQLLTECLLLSTASTAVALLFAQLCTSLLLYLLPYRIARIEQTSLDMTVFAFAALLAVVTATACGLAPAMQATRVDLIRALRQGAQGARGSAMQRRLRSILVMAEVALAMVLLTGAGLLVKTFLVLRPADPGFDPSNKLTLRMTLTDKRYPLPVQKAAFMREVSMRIGSIAGVRAVAATTGLPLSRGGGSSTVLVDGRSPAPDSPNVQHRAVSPNYFSVMGISMVAGREFSDADTRGGPLVAIVNQTMAQKFWPGESPLGRRLTLGQSGDKNQLVVVGVVRDARNAYFSSTPVPELYVPYDQSPDGYPTLLIHSAGDLSALVAVVRAAIGSADPNVLVTDIHPFDKLLGDAVARPRFHAILVGLLAALAMLLASVGIYGVIAYSVAQRTSEIGIRLALGALPADVLRLMLRNVLPVVAAGVVLGLGGAWVLTRYLKILLYDVPPTDPATFVTVTVLWFAVAALACLVPARRAVRIDPMVALRYE